MGQRLSPVAGLVTERESAIVVTPRVSSAREDSVPRALESASFFELSAPGGTQLT